MADTNCSLIVTVGDTINFTFSNSTSHPFTISGTTISGESATGGYYSTPTAESYTFSSTMTYTYVCNVHSSMTGSIIASAASAVNTLTSSLGNHPFGAKIFPWLLNKPSCKGL